MGHFFWFSLGWSFWFAWFTVHIWYISGSSHVCTHVSLSQVGFYCKGIWVEYPLTFLPLWPPRSFSVIRQVSWLGMRNMWPEQGPAFSFNCPAFLVLEFWSIQKESPIYPGGGRRWGGRGHWPPASNPSQDFTLLFSCMSQFLPERLLILPQTRITGNKSTVSYQRSANFLLQSESESESHSVMSDSLWPHME